MSSHTMTTEWCELTTKHEHSKNHKSHTSDSKQQPEHSEEPSHRPHPVDADEAAPGDLRAKQELQHDPALAARTEFGKPRSAGHQQRSSLRPKQPLLLSARASNQDTATVVDAVVLQDPLSLCPPVACTRSPGLSGRSRRRRQQRVSRSVGTATEISA